jgi:hypothetical protein
MLAHRDRRGARLAGRGLAVDCETNLPFEVLFRLQNIFLVLRIRSMFCEIRKRTFFWFCELTEFAELFWKFQIILQNNFQNPEPKKFRTKKKALQ